MRLIDADALIDDLMERYCKECDKRKGIKNGRYRIIYEIGEAPCRACEMDDLKAELDGAPTADVPDRKVGKWIEAKPMSGRIGKVCSACGCEAYWDSDYGQQLFDWCPYCGAEMEGDDDDKM